jgi:hypothetical protein
MKNKDILEKIIVGIGFVGVSVFLIKVNPIIGWIGLIFFGFVTILVILLYLFPKSKIINKLYVKITGKSTDVRRDKKEFLKFYNDDGIFEYNESGFLVQTDKSKEYLNWNQIYLMLGYKKDLFAIDLICLDVYYDRNKVFAINEETPGWFNFLKYSKNIFPEIEKNWELNISNPAFERKLTVIYDSKGRELPEILNEMQKKAI